MDRDIVHLHVLFWLVKSRFEVFEELIENLLNHHLFRRSSVSKRSSKTESRTTSPKISASEKLKQDVISILKKKEPKEDSDVEEVKPSVAALDNINSDTFKQRQFKSTANKQSKSYNSTSNIASRGLSALNPTLAALNSNRYRKQKDLQELSIFNDKFFMDEDEKIANWMKKLTEYRSAFVKLRKPVVDA